MPAPLALQTEAGRAGVLGPAPRWKASRARPPVAARAAANADADATPTTSTLTTTTTTRRALLAASSSALAAPWALVLAPPASAADAFTSPDKGYSLSPPPGWTLTSKAGADAFFSPPDGAPRGASLGVVVLPVRLRDLAGAGTLDQVGARLLDAEKAKDGTLGVALTRSEAIEPQDASSAVPSYRFEYVLATSRAFKTVVTATAVARGRLFIVTGMAPCAGGAGAAAAAVAEGRLAEGGVCEAGVQESVRAAVASFAVEP
jgi:hypothetical protein